MAATRERESHDRTPLIPFVGQPSPEKRLGRGPGMWESMLITANPCFPGPFAR